MSPIRDNVIQRATLLFNEKGFFNVSMQEIAKSLNISPGNLTYHFPKKEALVTALFQDFNAALAALPAQFDPEKGLLHFFLTLPEASFEITTQYLFLTTDYLELKRSYHDLFKVVDKLNAADSLVFQTEKQLNEYGDKLPADKKEAIEKAKEDLKEAHKLEDLAKIDTGPELDCFCLFWNQVRVRDEIVRREDEGSHRRI